MKCFYAVIFALCFFSCGKKEKEKPAKDSSLIDDFRQKYDKRVSEAKEKFDQKTGWPSATDCDGTLWAGLAKASGVDTVRVEQAEYEDGQIHRRPKSSGECYPNESKSTVSRDMLMGVFWGAWKSRDGDLFKRIARYGEGHAWIMGQPETALGEVLLTGNMIGLLGRINCELRKDCPEYRRLPPLHSKSDTDYVQHLTVLYILLNGEVSNPVGYTKLMGFPKERTYGDVSRDEFDVLKWHAEHSPNDLLFQTAYHLYEDGDFDEVIKNLMKDDFYVPTYVRGSENYPLVHWLFVSKLILQRY